MLTTTATWKREMRRSKPEIRYRVEIDLDPETTIRVVTGTEILTRASYHPDDYPPSVLGVSAKSAGFDPWTREVSFSERTIRLRADGLWRDMIHGYVVYSRPVRIYKGTPHVPASEWVVDWVGIVDDYSISDDGVLTLSCLDVMSLLEGVNITGYWYQMHPVELIYDMMVPSASPPRIPLRFLSTGSYNPRLYPRISHWNITRAGTDDSPPYNGQITDPKPALEAIMELLFLLGGTLRYDSTGKIEFYECNQDRPTERHLTRDQVRWARTAESGGPINKLIMGGWPKSRLIKPDYARGYGQPSTYGKAIPVIISDVDIFYKAEDVQSQRRLAMPGQSSRVIETRIDSEWIRAVSIYAITSGVLQIPDAEDIGFCGSRWTDIDESQEAEFTLGARPDRFLYVMTDLGEIIECDGYGTYDSARRTVNQTGRRARYAGAYNIRRRNVAGSTVSPVTGNPFASEYSGTRCWDVTIFYRRSGDMLARWAYGAPTVECGVSVENADIQPGDLVSLDHEAYAHLGFDRATHRTVFEVVGVADNTGDDDAEIVLTLSRAYVKPVTAALPPGAIDDVPLRPAPKFPTPELVPRIYTFPSEPSIPPIKFGEQLRHATESENTLKWQSPPAELAVTATSGTTISIAGGRAQGALKSSPEYVEAEHELGDDLVTYVRFNTRSGAIVLHETDAGDPEPERDPYLAPLAKVTVSGGSITGVVDLRRTGPTLPTMDIIPDAFPGRAGTKLRSGRAHTTDGSVTDALVVDVPPATSGKIKVQVSAYRSSNGHTAMWELTARVRNDGGGARLYDQVNSVISRDNSAWDADLEVDADTVIVRVTGAAATTLDWTVSAELAAADAGA